MTYLLIIFVIAVALAPLSHFVPSKRQREIARMREYAAVHGMFVEFRDMPARNSGRNTPRDPAGQETIYYGKRLPPARSKREKAQIWLCESEGWAGLERRDAVPDELQSLPGEVRAASVDAASCGVYWRESGGTAKVEAIRVSLEAWASRLRS